MYCPLKVTTDYSLLHSLVKIKDLIEVLKQLDIKSCAICDTNLYGSLDFYYSLKKNNIRPIIGLEVSISDKPVYLYAKNYNGYKHLLKINTLKQKKDLDFKSILNDNIKIIIPYISKDLYENKDNIFLGYSKDTEKYELLEISKNIVFVNDVLCLKDKDTKYIGYLELIKDGKTIKELDKKISNNYLINPNDLNKEDILSTMEFISNINIEIPENNKYIPKYYKCPKDSTKYLANLAVMGLKKRLNNEIPIEYKNRLKYELDVINKMGFVDYFLIVYDYVLYAKKNNILVGPGRGSAAGSLVSYCLGITEIDPLKYNLLFERFLNPDRITMPDIDIDFDYSKRNIVIDYVKKTYGNDKVAPIITFGTLASKQVLRDLGKVLEYDSKLIDKFVNVIDAKLSLKDNYNRDVVKKFISNYPNLKELYKICFIFEGLKRHISTHAAGIVISSISLDDIIPVYVENDNDIMCGITMEYLESIGLLKMDFLALRNLTIINNVLELIKDKQDIRLNEISLDDKKVYELFSKGLTEGIFQFESAGMKNLIMKFKPTCFADLVACIAIFRPGPMENIDTFIRRKNNQEKVAYLNDDLKEILSPTWGIIIYQEQIMQILVKMANFSYSEADNIRRAMSKKKKNIIEEYKEKFINNSVSNGYSYDNASKVYELILKFANYGFNKAHSVSYSLIAYQMAYLKVYYPEYFICNLLNMSIGSEIKTKEYLDEAKINGLKLLKPNINESGLNYLIKDKSILLPISIVKNLGENICKEIILERDTNGEYKDYLDFIARTYKLGVNKLVLESLINAGALDCFDLNKNTMLESITIAINYATLAADLDNDLVMKPEITRVEELDEDVIRQNEYDVLGFYLTNHPASKFQDGVVKSKDVSNYFDKTINIIGLIEKIKSIKTKKNEDMAFITISDEYGNIDLTLFPKQYNMAAMLKKGNIVKVLGKVTKRFANYSVSVFNIEKVS